MRNNTGSKINKTMYKNRKLKFNQILDKWSRGPINRSTLRSHLRIRLNAGAQLRS